MLFSGIMQIKYDKRSNIVSRRILNKILKNTPKSVKEQVYSDHWRKESFQEIYKNIEISSLNRELKEFSANNIIKCSYNPSFELLNTNFDNCNYMDIKSDIRKHRDKEKTRITPPVFINATILDKNPWLRLIEWHNRTWTLKGLVEKWLISPDSRHNIWYWKY